MHGLTLVAACPLLLCRQLYAGVADLLGLAVEAPEGRLLLTQFNMGDAAFALYDDLKVGGHVPAGSTHVCCLLVCLLWLLNEGHVRQARTGVRATRRDQRARTPPVFIPLAQARVSSIEDLRSRFSFSYSRAANHIYVAFVYPSAELGPQSGQRAVHVFHR
jgi:hypothetical protein